MLTGGCQVGTNHTMIPHRIRTGGFRRSPELVSDHLEVGPSPHPRADRVTVHPAETSKYEPITEDPVAEVGEDLGVSVPAGYIGQGYRAPIPFIPDPRYRCPLLPFILSEEHRDESKGEPSRASTGRALNLPQGLIPLDPTAQPERTRSRGFAKSSLQQAQGAEFYRTALNNRRNQRNRWMGDFRTLSRPKCPTAETRTTNVAMRRFPVSRFES